MVKILKRKPANLPIKGGAFSDVAPVAIEMEVDAPRPKINPGPEPPQHIKNESTRLRLLKFVNLKI